MNKRKTSPRVEGLESRELLSQISYFAYKTPQGTHVSIKLYGAGTLSGTTVASNGALNLVYSGTDSSTGIVGKVRGGNGRAFIATISNAKQAIDDLSGSESTALALVNLKNFNLEAGGNINLTGGVGSLFLNSAAQNSQIHLSALPQSSSSGSGSPTTTTTTSSSSTTTTSGFTIETTKTTTTTGTSTSSTSTQGFVPAFGQEATGVNVVINHVNGALQQFPPIGDPQIFGYDAVQNALIKFDATTGAVLQTIPLSMPASTQTGVSLDRYNGTQVVLVGSGTTVQAFNATTGVLVGSFSISNLASSGFTAIDGLASSGIGTYIVDSTDGSTGAIQRINVDESLASGQVVTIGSTFYPSSEFYLSGGATGVPASPVLYLQGAGFFDQYQPNLYQNGILAYGKTGSTKGEVARAELPGPSTILNAGNPANPTLTAVGSVNTNLAIVTGVSNGQNDVTLYNDSTLAQGSTITLNDANPLTDISGTFFPQLAGAALVDVQGNLRSFRSQSAKGLVVNETGFLNLVQIVHATNTEVIGLPIGAANIPYRKNVLLLSSSRTKLIGMRNGVNVVNDLQPVGPLSLPNDNS